MRDLKTIKLRFTPNVHNSYFSIKKMTLNELREVLQNNNIMLGETIFTLYDLEALRNMTTKSQFNEGLYDIIYTRDLIKHLGPNGQLL